MFKSMLIRTTLTLVLLLSFSPTQATADELSQLQQQLDRFKQSKYFSFAPQTIKRADAYLGAAMLANEQDKTVEYQHALTQAKEKLAEARQTAKAFMAQSAALIALRRDSSTILDIVTPSGQSFDQSSRNAPGSPSTQQYLNTAQSEFNQTISSYELGQLNQSQAHGLKAQQAFEQIMQRTIPRLTELTANAVGKAANAGAKQYAPQIYQAAKDKLVELHTFSDGLSHAIPQRPEQGLYLAREAKHMAEQVKAWRKKTRSHESIVLKQRRANLKLANALQISSEHNPMLTIIRNRDLLAAIKKNNKALADERQAHKQDIIQLKQQAKEELQRQLAAQTDSLEQAQQNRMSTVKEAFRAKLERETFDSKRQQKLHQLFKPGEVEVLVNLDGSLLLRLSGLKFAPSKSKIKAKYFDLLGRLNEAMSIYQDRSLRIEGHTDSFGDVKPNQVLSLKRAEAVRDFLIAAGADGSRLKALGYGEVRPIASNEFKQGRAMNRRIDVIINAKK
ncbi:MAG: OmpA family protein [Mariprofundus sp.]|nr:OmpA family protein [Mariprofundus sp.]